MGVLVSLTAMVLVISIMNSLNANQRERLLAIDPHLVISLDGPAPEKTAGRDQKNKILEFLKTKNAFAAEVEVRDLILKTYEGRFRGVEARGLPAEVFQFLFEKMRQLSKKNKNYSFIPDQIPGRAEVNLGVDLAYALQIFEGEELTFISPEQLVLSVTDSPQVFKVRVKNILTTNITDIDSHVVFYQLGQLQRKKAGDSSVQNQIFVWLDAPDQAPALKKILKSELQVDSQDWQERNSSLFFALKLEKLMMVIFLGMGALIAALSLISVVSLLISQKRREISLLQCLGFSKTRTQNLFFSLSFVLGSLGIVSGLAFGIGLSIYLEKFPFQLPWKIYYDTSLSAIVDPWMIFAVAMVFILMLIASSFLTAKQVLDITISEGIKKSV